MESGYGSRVLRDAPPDRLWTVDPAVPTPLATRPVARRLGHAGCHQPYLACAARNHRLVLERGGHVVARQPRLVCRGDDARGAARDGRPLLCPRRHSGRDDLLFHRIDPHRRGTDRHADVVAARGETSALCGGWHPARRAAGSRRWRLVRPIDRQQTGRVARGDLLRSLSIARHRDVGDDGIRSGMAAFHRLDDRVDAGHRRHHRSLGVVVAAADPPESSPGEPHRLEPRTIRPATARDEPGLATSRR
ncbi:hypothetical protein ACVWWN_007365 [Mycobacterium sp. URHB0021]